MKQHFVFTLPPSSWLTSTLKMEKYVPSKHWYNLNRMFKMYLCESLKFCIFVFDEFTNQLRIRHFTNHTYENIV
jgi:hypothetical protein